MNPIPVLLITHNRLAYSTYALASILEENAGVPVEITIWDNKSKDGTDVWLKYLKHPQIDEIVMSPINVGVAHPMNYMFKKYRAAPYVCKVDCDTVLPKGWLRNLHEVMRELRKRGDPVGAISAYCLRPNGMTAKDWYASMTLKSMVEANKRVELRKNSYICGTGVLINMDMIREIGLLSEAEPCKMGGWTSYCRHASEKECNFYFHMGVFARLLNLESDHTLSNDYPEYDQEMAKVREDGNAWWESIHGLEGIKKLIEENGGYEQL